MELPAYLKEIFKSGKINDLEGNERDVGSTVSEAEAVVLMRMVIDTNARNTLETGVAYGASAMAMCEALKKYCDHGECHYGVDPNQHSEYGGAALAALKQDDLDGMFELLEGPSHLMLPLVINKNLMLDCAFVDGWHTFDYTLIDFFLIDKMLRPGGLIAFHDMNGRAKQKVLGYILSHREYEVANEYRVAKNESRIRTLKFFIARIFEQPALILSWFHWNYQLRNSSGLIVLRKKSNFEPGYTFFKRF
ncbi:MAG: class I SAM-dependent methyltransferase [Colwellia sp.]|nr:class I SAM-dependent methyltransferase [Colwellia sp.]